MQGLLRRRSGWLSTRLGDELVMMSVETGFYLSVSRVGARIWDLIEPPCAIDDVCASLVREYQVTPEACRRDVVTFVTEMQSKGAIEFQPPLETSNQAP